MCLTIGRREAEGDEVGKEILPTLRQQLVALLANEVLTPAQRAESGDALGKLGDPRPGVCTLEPDMIPIEAGPFIYGVDNKTRTIEQPFAVSRYPVTVAQFGMFRAAGGYEQSRYWGGEDSPGWRWRVKDHPDHLGIEPVTQPVRWLHPQWHVANRPVIGVSWHEALAYCAWLTE